MEVKTEVKVSYDDRRKELIQTFSQMQDVKVGEKVVGIGKVKRVSTFNEEGIRNILKDLNAQKKIVESNLKILNELQEKHTINPRQEQLKEDLRILQVLNHQENSKPEVLKKELVDLKNSKKDLAKLKKDIQDIKSAIGSRLRL